MSKTALDLQRRALALVNQGLAQQTSDAEFNELAQAAFGGIAVLTCWGREPYQT